MNIMYDNEGHIIKYEVIEEPVAGYKLTYNKLEGSEFVLKNDYVEPTETPTVEPSEETVIETTEEPVLGPTQDIGELVTAAPSDTIEETDVEGTDEITGDEEDTKLLETPKISESLEEDVSATSSTDDIDGTPETRDVNNMSIYIFTLLLSVCGIAVLIYRKNRA